MKRLYEKSEILFSVSLIALYVFVGSFAEMFFKTNAATMILYFVLSLDVLIFIKNKNLFEKYGICKPKLSSKKLLYYIPLVFLSSVNLWFSIKMNFSPMETVFFVISMIFVGFLEEIIFRGFLFKAMAKDNLKSAVIVSSVTFGIGHIVNLLNGNETNIISNLCQIVSAIAFGFLFVLIFQKSKSLIPCIISHSAINALSAFNNEEVYTNEINIVVSAVLFVVALSYAFYIHKKVKSVDF